MATAPPPPLDSGPRIYGMDKELKEKQDAKYDIALEKEVSDWIEAVSGESRGDLSFAAWLKDGQVLCKLANAIEPGIVKKVNTSSLPFKQMENITFFMNAARNFGVSESAMFGTPDLYEEKNMGSVVNCIYTLGGVLQASVDFNGPTLGIAINAESKDKARGSRMLTDQSAGFSGAMEVQRPNERADYVVKPVDRSGLAGGAGGYVTKVPSTETTKKQLSTPSPPKSPEPRPVQDGISALAAQARTPEKATTPEARTPERSTETPAKTNAAPPPPLGSGPRTYGMDKDLKAKQDAKYDVGLETEVKTWIESLTGEAQGEQTFAAWLKDGRVLCSLANALKPGSVKKINTSSLAFKQMENITFFMNAAREFGVPETSMFGTPDLYDQKNMGSVVNCIYCLGGVVQATLPEFKGPHLGIKISQDTSKDRARADRLTTDLHGGFSTSMT